MSEQQEADTKLQSSFLQKLYTEFKNINIQRPITLKGYTEAVHVDTFEGRFHATKTYLYPSTGYKYGRLFQEPRNIDLKKLAGEQNKKIEEMKTNQPGDQTESMAKAIKITLKPK